jgi:hypothetical protein
MDSTLHIWDTVAVRSEILTYGDGSARVEIHPPAYMGERRRPMIATWETEPEEDAATTVQEWIAARESENLAEYDEAHATN